MKSSNIGATVNPVNLQMLANSKYVWAISNVYITQECKPNDEDEIDATGERCDKMNE